jgi:hypothetical protein
MKTLSDGRLFDAIHDGRPERLAQLVLAHALRTEPQLQSFLKIPANAEVKLERPGDDGRSGWRADIEAGSLRLELKIRAKFTKPQVQALSDGQMGVVVVPHDRLREFKLHAGTEARLISWKELANYVDNPGSKALLLEADQAKTYLTSAVRISDIASEMERFVAGGDAARWKKMYGFLSALHVDLHELAQTSYDAPGGWTFSRTQKPPYYGYCFSLNSSRKSPAWWVGFEGLGASIALVLYRRAERDWGDPLRLGEKNSLDSSKVAEQLLAVIRSSV